MNGFWSNGSTARLWQIVSVACIALFLVGGELSIFNTTVFQYDRFGTEVYYAISSIAAIALWILIFRLSSNAGIEGKERFYLTIMLSGAALYGAYLVNIPDRMLGFVPGFWSTRAKHEDVLLTSIYTNKFRGTFRHYAGFGDRNGIYSVVYFPILDETYGYIVRNTPNPVDAHIGIDVIQGVCFEAEVATAAHLRRIDVGTARAPLTSFKRC